MQEINGDNKLSVLEKLKYFLINIQKFFYFKKIKLYNTNYKVKKKDNNLLINLPSPARYLQNYYIKHEINKKISRNKIHVLDVGCGSSEVAELLEYADFHGEYTGIDIRNYYDSKLGINSFSKKFIKNDILKQHFDEKFDLIISNSVMEHIKQDIIVFQKLQTLLNKNGFQIHLVPSRFSLFLYLFHGWRQYSIFDANSKLDNVEEVIYLGGAFSFFLHLFLLTIPQILFKKDLRKFIPNLYSFLLHKSVNLDKFLPFFYTTIIFIKNGKNK